MVSFTFQSVQRPAVVPCAPMKDEFLSEEDLDLAEMSWPERVAYWNLWLRQAQGTNAEDECEYSHGVMVGYREPRSFPDAESEDLMGVRNSNPAWGLGGRR